VALPGEAMRVFVLKEGKEPGQASPISMTAP